MGRIIIMLAGATFGAVLCGGFGYIAVTNHNQTLTAVILAVMGALAFGFVAGSDKVR